MFCDPHYQMRIIYPARLFILYFQNHNIVINIHDISYDQFKTSTSSVPDPSVVNTLRPRQNGRRFADDTFKCIFLNENVRISIKISLKFVTKGPIYNNPELVQIMAWRRSGDKPLSEPMMVSLLTHLCVTRPQWVNIQHIILPKMNLVE